MALNKQKIQSGLNYKKYFGYSIDLIKKDLKKTLLVSLIVTFILAGFVLLEL